jgi:peptide/nickel transport system permease protein
MRKGRSFAIKLFRGLVTVWIVVTLTFAALHLSGDPIETLVGDQAPPEVVAHYRAKFGLDRPLWQQYLAYFANIAQGDFGLSMSDRTPATTLILQALPKTVLLGLTAYVGGLLMGVVLGVIAAMNRDGALDRMVMSFATFGFSIPNFFLGILLILIFALYWRVLPAAGSDSPAHLLLPALTLGTHLAGTFARFTRSAMLDVLNRPYMVAAEARGVPRLRRIFLHALPNAAIPIVTIAGLKIGDLVAGSVVVETVFAWPGVGRLLVNAVASRDFAVVQTILIMVAVSMTLANLAVDAIYTLIDPRIRTSRA